MHKNLNGLVLRQVDINDADRLLTVLTREDGKLTLKARGIKRKSSRLKAACQLLTYSEFTVFQNRERRSINEAEVKAPFVELREDLELFALASYFAELLDAVTDEGIASDELLSLALNSYYALSMLDKPPELVKAVFELRLMSLIGLEPLLEGCSVCDKPEPERINIKQGLLHCAGCRLPASEGLSLPLCGDSLAAMRHIARSHSKRIFSFSIGGAAAERLFTAAELYTQAQLERGFKTLDFYKDIKAAPGKNPLSP